MADIVSLTDGEATVRSIVADVINATWNYGTSKQDEFSSKISAAQTGFLDSTAAPHVSAGAVAVPSVVEPAIDIPTTQSAGDVLAAFDGKYAELVAMLSDKFASFRATYFPDESNAYIAAENWLQEAMSNPDSGIPAAVQAQIWGEDQARILSDTTRASDAVIASFAARRFPLPPDAATNAVMQIQQKAQDELAKSSRSIAALSVEMQKFNVTSLLALRQSAMDSAIKYITAIASAPDMASRLVGVGYDAQSKLISSAAQFMGARTQAAELVSKVNQYNNSIALEADTKNQAVDMQLIEDKLKALLSEAESIARSATALFNNIHANAGISANRSASVGYSYSNETSGKGPVTTDVG